MGKSSQTISGIVLACIVAFASPAPAQGPSQEQLRQLEQLTPAQTDAIRKALDDTQSVVQPPITEPSIVEPRNVDAEGVAGEDSEAEDDVDDGDAEWPPLRRFGYDLFAGEPTTFAPATDIPIPVDYVIGPGDTIELQLFGSQNAFFSLVVARDGVLNLPEIGPVPVSGLKFSDLRETIQQRISEQMIGVKASITMGRLRSIRIFILGDAHRPGSYTVSALSTMTNALFVSGGISPIGSLREVQLKRNGRLVGSLDLYDLLLRGDTSSDARLQPGDVIFIPPVGPTVGVDGQVRRPAIYEIRGEKTVAEVIELAGGLLPSAYPQASQIERINEERERTIISVDLTASDNLARSVVADDVVRIFSVLEKKEDVVFLSGHVYREGTFQWRPGMRMSNLVETVDDLMEKADLHYVLVRREDPVTQQVSAFSADLTKVFASSGGDSDPLLRPKDRVIVFDQESDRREVIDPLLAELRLQGRHDDPAPIVGVSGRVRTAGKYPLEDGMRVSDLIRAGGFLHEAAYVLEAELTRYGVGSGQGRETELVNVDLARVLSGDTTADITLQPYDILNIKEIPLWRELEVVEIQGEVRFPGNYPIRRGERMSSILQRAGGLTDLAFAEGAVFLRTDLRRREQEQLNELAKRLAGEVESAAAGSDEDSAAQAARRALLQQVEETEATGRLVIDLPQILQGGSTTADVVLQDGDRLLVPRQSQTVTIIGEVQFPTSHVFESNIGRSDYIERSGGLTSRADKRRIYVVRANGGVITSSGSRFFRGRNGGDIRPGDTIVVPLDADYISRLSLWTSVTTIIYNIGVAAAAVASFN
jgi:polysaccharide export outer membrane protein